MHAGQLMFRNGLVLINNALKSLDRPYSYFSTLAKLCNLWRENSRKFYSVWMKEYGPVSAVQYARNMVSQCVSGRWGSVGDTEVELSNAGGVGGLRLVRVFSEVLQGKADQEADALVPADSGILELQLEQQTSHRRRMGRWAREMIAAISDPVFWVVLEKSRKRLAYLTGISCTSRTKARV